MKLLTRIAVVLLPLVTSLCIRSARAIPPEDVERDQTGVYRLDPNLETIELALVPPAEIRPGFAYNYYSERLSRRAWGLARDDGNFQYAFGEGTVMPTTRLDLRLSFETKRQILDRGAPGLQERLERTGGTPAVQLDSTGQWRLLRDRSTARVFDIETGHRWEWHGERRAAVLHTLGDQWIVFNGRYLPATGVFPVGPYPWCGLHRAGTAADVIRTAEVGR